MFEEIDCSNSTAIEKLVYDRTNKDLYVLYRRRRNNENVYIYKGVNENLIDGLLNGQSIGLFVSNIRRLHPFTRSGSFPTTGINNRSNNNRNNNNNNRNNHSNRRNNRDSNDNDRLSPDNRQRLRSIRGDFSVEWIKSIEAAKGNEERLIELMELLLSYPPTRPPSRIPPVFNANNYNTNGNTTTDNNNSNRGRFSALEDSDDNDDTYESTVTLTNNRNTNTRRNTNRNNDDSLQCRYLVALVKCSISECIRSKADEADRQSNYQDVATFWIEAYEYINTFTIEIDEWYAILIDSENYNDESIELPGYHNKQQLANVYSIISLLQDDTEGHKDKAIQQINRKIEHINRELQPKLNDRNLARAKYGEYEWTHNPNPKLDYVALRKQLVEDKKALENLLHSLTTLTFIKYYRI